MRPCVLQASRRHRSACMLEPQSEQRAEHCTPRAVTIDGLTIQPRPGQWRGGLQGPPALHCRARGNSTARPNHPTARPKAPKTVHPEPSVAESVKLQHVAVRQPCPLHQRRTSCHIQTGTHLDQPGAARYYILTSLVLPDTTASEGHRRMLMCPMANSPPPPPKQKLLLITRHASWPPKSGQCSI
jgi:hypothetical protein